ncbi:MAG TPA: pseudouridine synthase [Verrucomicrobiae bacterium]|nr:pseudouridine synthase [Verrucomicrobiae bacterium]
MNGIILFEDEHLLAVNKPSGINTHKPDRFAPDGIHEWLTKRETRWRTLSILHRLDKDTSGVMVFGKTASANQSLAHQFESHRVEKTYLLLSAARPTRLRFRAKSPNAVTEFALLEQHGELSLIEARPVTGKTHQIRRHAADNGFPILGDELYGGPAAPRLMLHAHTIAFDHPASGQRVSFTASVPRAFDEIDPLIAALEFREVLFDSDTNVCRLISGAADGFPGVVVDSYAGHLLVQWQTESATRGKPELLGRLTGQPSVRAVFEQIATKQSRTPPQCVWRDGSSVSRDAGAGPATGRRFAEAPAPRLMARECGLTFLVNFGEGLSTGLFLDQRENRRRLRATRLEGKTVLNTFAYTCAFSVAAANAGAATTSVDLSRNYLEWGKDNFRANDLDPGAHEFVVGDAFEWLKRFGKRGRSWDVVIVDPPTFSTTKRGRVFQAARDYEDLAALAMPLVARGGRLLCSTNQRTLEAEDFEKCIRAAARRSGRVIESAEFETLPFDFRVAPSERPYLKAWWIRLD